jgi:hypothetical protein
VVVTRSETRALRRVVRQLPVEMLQQCSSASNCMQTCIVIEKHYTGCQHSAPFVLNGPTQFFLCVLRSRIQTLLWSYCFMNSTISTPFLPCPRKQLPLDFWQADKGCLSILWLFGGCVRILCFPCSLLSIFTNET